MSDDSVVIPQDTAPERLPEVEFTPQFLAGVWDVLDDTNEGRDARLELVASALAGNYVPAWSEQVFHEAAQILKHNLRYPDENVPTLVTALLAWRRSR
jgi:hypothetical protein